MRISDWSSDVCSSDLQVMVSDAVAAMTLEEHDYTLRIIAPRIARVRTTEQVLAALLTPRPMRAIVRSEEHTSELQSLMRISYAVLFLKKKNNQLAYVQCHHTHTYVHFTLAITAC